MKLVNLTPHAICLRAADGTEQVVPPSGTVARVTQTPGELEDRGLHVPVALPSAFGEVTGLPEPAPETYYVASSLVAGRVARPDVLAPGTGPADNPVRDDAGRIVAVTRLVAFTRLVPFA